MNKVLGGIRDSIRELANRANISQNRAFAAWYAITFYNVDEDDALEAAAADGGNDQGIDIVFPDDANQEIVVLQAYYPMSESKATPKAKWDALTASLPFIQQPKNFVNAGRPDLAELVENAKRDHPDYPFAVGLISLGQRSVPIVRAKSALENAGTYGGIAFSCNFQEDITEKYQSLIEAENGIPEDELSFCDDYFEDSGDYGRAWVGSVSAAELRRLYEVHHDRLFAGNIRLYLGVRKGGINEQISRTATSAPGIFWALNNGITIVADSIATIPVNAKSKTGNGDSLPGRLRLKRFSIVNGCQTTSSLVRLPKVPVAKVLARVIAAKGGLRNDIVRFNNSQNAIKIWTVRAADSVQERIRRELKAIGIDYAPKQAGARQRKDKSIVQLDKVAQYLAASDQRYLVQAINNKAELFDEPYQRIFKKDVRCERVLLAWILGNMADERRQERVEQLGTSDTNVGLLGVASVLWIIYCTYKLLERLTDLDSDSLSLKKIKTIEFANALTRYVDVAIDMFYESAVDTYERSEYGSFKSTLRSAKFLGKIDSKVNNRISRLPKKALPNLVSVAKSAKG